MSDIVGCCDKHEVYFDGRECLICKLRGDLEEGGLRVDELRQIANEKYVAAKGKAVDTPEFKEFRKAVREFAREHLLELYPEIIKEDQDGISSLQSKLTDIERDRQGLVEEIAQLKSSYAGLAVSAMAKQRNALREENRRLRKALEAISHEYYRGKSDAHFMNHIAYDALNTQGEEKT